MCDASDASVAAPTFLHEEPGRTVFEGQVLRKEHDWGVDWDVHNGGWNGQGADTWLSEHVHGRFEGKRVRVTVEVLGDGEGDA
jgi:hypothetical protein